MTILSATYLPETAVYSDTQDTYPFTFEIIGPDAFELWYIDENDNRTRAAVADYVLELNSRPPIHAGGRMRLTVDQDFPPEGHPIRTATSLSLERNTPITQLADFQTYAFFPVKQIEFVLDKHTMICQELAYRKCDAVVTTEMTQLIAFTPYTPLRASEVKAGLDKLIAILAEIDATAEDCSDRPDEA